ncbi:long-chain acyl-CoA synthetase [Sphingomonas naasensis]|uniref:Long-chain fatty acid--CoA ligase n=1 Tax=Sphingomonas naasensis TaxID=1344951 RepID=A0A4S1WFR1_9SPHN|nr:AMP-binding protein [Sphingomonas naasensis]NIJ21609.1 long-chain acyl-CoA synthetase [Sphingomonas naasensis]TGX41453.1 long-chain fatty acid--CoA ligase [Sphingomonas naasensis]
MSDFEHVWRTAYRHPGRWDDVFPPVSMVTLFEASTAAHPQAPLLDFMGRKYSYAETLDGARRVACGLKALGYGPGDRIGLFLPNVPHYVAAYYGILMLGATVVNFSPLYSVDELSAQVADSGTKLLFTLSASALLPTALKVLEASALERLVVGSIAGALPAAKSLFYRWFRGSEVTPRPEEPRILAFSRLIANPGQCESVAIDPERDVALIQYTGGTTGTPKGAVLTHQNLSANARQVAQLDPDMGKTQDSILGVLPFFHVFANTCVLNRTVLTGGEIVMLPRFNAKQALAELRRTRPRSLPGVPTMYQALLDAPGMKPSDFSSLKFCISGGAPLPAQLKEEWERITGARVIEGYGLSESSGVVSTNPYDGLNKPGTIGQPLAATRVRLVDKEDPTRAPPQGEPGEIVVSGPQIMQGYWNRPDADAEVFVDDHWLRTGDVGLIDEDGYIRIVDRLKDMIAVGGFKVFPSQIEAVLYRHPAVKEALVLGLPDAYHGELPHAYVVLDEDVEPVSGPELCIWLNGQLGKHERVSEVVIRDSLPKTMIGKLSRKDLLAEVRGEA